MKNKLLINVGLIGAFLILLSSCSGLKLTADYDKTIDFTKYKSIEFYGWAKESDKVINGLDRVRIEDAFAKEFYDRGMHLVESDGDVVVTLFIVVEQKTEQRAETTHMGGGYGGYYGGYYGYGPGYGWGTGYSTTTVREYDYAVGTLVCDVFDKKNEQLIWEGIASKTIDSDPNTRDKRIPEIIRRLMLKYPIPPVKK